MRIYSPCQGCAEFMSKSTIGTYPVIKYNDDRHINMMKGFAIIMLSAQEQRKSYMGFVTRVI